MKLSIFLGDIADAPAEALCTSTNPRLSLMMGTGASVRARGGPAILRACEAVRGGQLLPAGSVHPTTAGALPHKVVLHCVASDAAHNSSETIIRSCVVQALAGADTAGCASIAMPIFATGHAHLRFDDAVRVMAKAVVEVASRPDVPPRVGEVTFVTNDEERVNELRDVLQEIAGGRIEIERSPEIDSQPDSLWSDDYSLEMP